MRQQLIQSISFAQRDGISAAELLLPPHLELQSGSTHGLTYTRYLRRPKSPHEMLRWAFQESNLGHSQSRQVSCHQITQAEAVPRENIV